MPSPAGSFLLDPPPTDDAPAGRPSPGPASAPLEDVLAAFEELARDQASELARQNVLLRRQNRELREAYEQRGNFVAMVSHELRAPLTAVISYTEMLLAGYAGPVAAEQTEYLGTIARSGQSLLELINDMLDLAKIDAGRMSFRDDAFDLREPVVEAETLARALIRQKGQVLMMEAPSPVPCRGDPERVRQMVLNLLSNAVKFTPDGGHIHLRVREVAEPGAHRAELTVRDSGPGIAPEHHDAIFLPFRQVPDGTSHHRGTGLGLALVRRFAHAMQGEVFVQSAPGAGASFTVRLPSRATSP